MITNPPNKTQQRPLGKLRQTALQGKFMSVITSLTGHSV